MSNSHKLGSVVLIIAMMILMPILIVGCGRADNGSQGSNSKPSMPDEQYYGYIKAKFDAESPAQRVQLMQLYLSAYPKGKHMGEATALLENAKQQNEEYAKQACINNMRQIESAKEQWALAGSKAQGTPLDTQEVAKYMGRGGFPSCPGGGTYSYNTIGTDCKCSIQGHRL